ncbi:hypothetical protein Nepgr_000491 [Nepenthes gracilis]|uniref:Uncharacterized protein n=1 Tax=Nepenthes gracilis TaxID=150966 RepID=A0AAD3RVH5_NEPGR|nr:hypothetical protein Nepgr_000491 [Nepenthes gracilis]
MIQTLKLLPANTRRAAYVAIMRNSSVKDRKGTLATSLDPDLVLEVLDLLLSNEVRDQDVIYVLAWISLEGRETAWKWLKSVKISCHADYLHIDGNNTQCREAIRAINDCIGSLDIAHILEPGCSTPSLRRNTLNWDRCSLEEDPSDFLHSLVPEHWC